MDLSENKPPNTLLRRLILEDLKQPVIFRGLMSEWRCLSWQLKDWAEKLGDKLMPFRSGVRKYTSTPQWERNCQVTYLTMKEFLELAERNGIASATCPNWFYFDYKYMHEWFDDKPDIVEALNWEALGFPEVRGEQTTVWIGSDGAHTPCHYDTYGNNLVAQIYGMKQWILFPPRNSESLLPIRVPYEESSVYSKHNFYAPDPNVVNGLPEAWVINLQPGEVLFVPNRWWHYVENIGTAISVNTWLPLPSDNESRLEEALVKLLVARLSKEIPNGEFLLNPNDEEEVYGVPLNKSAALLNTCMKLFHKEQLEKDQECTVPQFKKMKFSSDDSDTSTKTIRNSVSEFDRFIHLVSSCSGEELKQLLIAKQSRFKGTVEVENHDVSPVVTTVEKVINALCHPDVISIVKTKLYQEFYGNNSI